MKPSQIIVGLVVILIVVLVFISMTKSGKNPNRTTPETWSPDLACKIPVTQYCANNPAALDTTGCTECAAADACGARQNFSCGRN